MRGVQYHPSTYFVVEYQLRDIYDPFVIDKAIKDFTNAYVTMPTLSQLTIHCKLMTGIIITVLEPQLELRYPLTLLKIGLCQCIPCQRKSHSLRELDEGMSPTPRGNRVYTNSSFPFHYWKGAILNNRRLNIQRTACEDCHLLLPTTVQCRRKQCWSGQAVMDVDSAEGTHSQREALCETFGCVCGTL